MKFGICLPIRIEADAGTNVNIARTAEELGFDSVWASDHVIMPENRVGMFSENFYDPFVLLSYISAETTNISIGTSVIILPYRNPVVVAKMIATIDTLSGGRVIFGVGPGWMREEFETLGVQHNARGRMTNEYLRAIKVLWETDSPDFEGEFVKFSGIKFYPKPHQKPHPPIWIAGSSVHAIKRAVRLGDGWHPTWVSPEDVERGIKELRGIAAGEGRDLRGFAYTVRNRIKIIKDGGDKFIDKGGNEPSFALRGTIGEITDYIAKYRELGVSHIVFDPDVDNADEIFEIMEQLAEEVLPEFSG
jgi:probable F420-dependent oxidoreductase